jgi:hypothetical protein
MHDYWISSSVMHRMLKDFVVVELIHKMTQIGSFILLEGLFHEISDLQLFFSIGIYDSESKLVSSPVKYSNSQLQNYLLTTITSLIVKVCNCIPVVNPIVKRLQHYIQPGLFYCHPPPSPPPPTTPIFCNSTCSCRKSSGGKFLFK